MAFERKIILVKLAAFLTGEISANEIYERALFVAVSREYETLAKTDPLVESVIQFLVEINSERVRASPIRKILEYFVACLQGVKNFNPEELQAIKGEHSAKPSNPNAVPAPPKESKSSKIVDILIKIYVFLFLLASGAVNILTIVLPELLIRPGEIPPPSQEVIHAATPHLIYAISMLLALTIKVPRILFYGLFFISTGGMFFYWYTATDFVLKQGQSLIHLIPILPIVALPPTCMFFIMLNRWFSESEAKPRGAVPLTKKD